MAEVGSSVQGADIGQFQGGHPSGGGVLKQAGPLCLRTSWIQLAIGEVQDLWRSRMCLLPPGVNSTVLQSSYKRPSLKAGREADNL